MKAVRFRPEAEADAAEAAAFYASRNPGLDEEFLAELQATLELAATAPELGTPHRMGTRRLILRRFPFSVVYRVEADFIWVVAVAHHRRRPGYWRRRT